MKMPFGKHKDKDLTEIPKGYLRWLRSQDWVAGWLAQSVDEVLNGNPAVDGQEAPERSTEELICDIVKPWEDQMGWPWASNEDE